MNRAARRSASRSTSRRQPANGLHRLIQAGIRRTDKEIRAAEIARPMRELFRQLKTGEVYVVDGRAAMRMPEVDPAYNVPGTEWVDIAVGIKAWIDAIKRMAPNLRTDKMGYIAELLGSGKEFTPRLAEQASEQFEAAVAMIPALPDGAIRAAMLTTELSWEFERIKGTA